MKNGRRVELIFPSRKTLPQIENENSLAKEPFPFPMGRAAIFYLNFVCSDALF